jgi:hypothetical protein
MSLAITAAIVAASIRIGWAVGGKVLHFIGWLDRKLPK